MKRVILSGAFATMLLLVACNTEEPVEEETQEGGQATTEAVESEEVAEAEDSETTVEEEPKEEIENGEKTPVAEESDVPEVIEELHLTDVRNDATGEWQKSTTASDANMPDNAVAYYETHMNGDGTHYIISFATNTTTMINAMGNTIYVTITEYVDGEEHDASEIGAGMLLKDYAVDVNDGSIEEIE